MIKLGTPERIEAAPRYMQFNRSNAIRDIFDALVEIITNGDDSYHRLFVRQKRSEDGGPILIEIKERRHGSPSTITVKDRAEGMTIETMRKKLKTMGEQTNIAEERGRAFMARGLRDCTELGEIIVESIVDGKYHGCKLTHELEFIPLSVDKEHQEEEKKRLKIEKGNGTVITIDVNPHHSIPRIDTIIRDLPWHYSLRDILSVHSPTKLAIKNLNKKNGAEKILYMQPEGELLVNNKKFSVPGYPEASCSFTLWKTHDLLDDSKGERFRRSGILIKGERAIHECSLLYPGFEKDDFAKRYFGRLECPYIDVLLKEYDERRQNKIIPPENNPVLLIDPNRQTGLRRDHPFVQALFQIPVEILKEFIEGDKKERGQQKQEVANNETQKRFSELAKAASKFLSEQVEEIEDFSGIDNGSLAKTAFIYPTYLSLVIGEIRTLTFYTHRNKFPSGKGTVSIWSDDKDSLSVLDRECALREHPKRNDLLICSFRVEGRRTKQNVAIKAKCSDLFAQAFAKITESKIDEHIFTAPLEFEYKQVQIREGEKRRIRLFAKYPELIANETQIQIMSSDSDNLPIRGRCIVKPKVGTNYAVGDVIIQARGLKHEPIKVVAKLDEQEAILKVKIARTEEPNVSFSIKLDSSDDFGNFRAVWDKDEQGNSVLKIFAKHDSIKRYLGPAPEFQGQNSPHFKILLAEIVAESVCRKLLESEAKVHSWEFRWADLKDDDRIAADVVASLQKRIRNFVTIAHQIMLKDSEVPTN